MMETLAFMPAATLAAARPATPPPITVTGAGRTPDTPESNIPMPPFLASRQ
jgi:hypothetical protein